MEINMRKKRSPIWDMPLEDFKKIVSSSNTLSDILKVFGLLHKGGNCKTLKNRILYEKIDISHIKLGRGSNAGRTFKQKKSLEEIFSLGSNTKRSVLKRKLIKHKILEYKCYGLNCKVHGSWLGKEICLHLEHKNGISNDNRIENLTLLCPNCHSQTPTYAGKNARSGLEPLTS
jgi:hypothetical protein